MRPFVLILTGVLAIGLIHADAQAQPAKPNDLGPEFRTACWNGDLNKATMLLNEGAPLEGTDNLGRTPLFLASHGDPDVVKLLLAHGAKIDAAENDGDEPISHACEFGDLASAKMLLDAGADFNVVNKYGHTPLMLAAREGHDALVSLLISHHVDVNFQGVSASALCIAIRNDHLSTVKLLLDAGADSKVFAQRSGPKDPRINLLSWAAWSNDFAMIDLLLAHGADLNGRSEDGTTPLINAVKGAKPETIGYLLEKGADVNLQDDEGETALMISTNYQQEPVWQNLLSHGAKLEIKDKQGRTALIWACYYIYNPAIRFLIDHGADINAADLQGETPLTYAGDRGDSEMVQLLKDKGAKRTDVHIIAKEKPGQPLPPAHAWALAVGAIYAQTNGVNPGVLGYADSRSVDEIRARLKQDWGITDTASFLKTLDELQTTGHRAGYKEKGAKLAAMSDDAFKAFLAANALLSGARANASAQADRDCYRTWKDRTGLAWDLCRYANLVNQGYAAGYVENWEAWDMLLVNARQVQGSFSSWQEMSDNFLDARQIWAGNRDPKFEACSKLLVNPQDPNSPWTQNPWKTDLATPAAP